MTALAHRDAIVLVGAQAVYLRVVEADSELLTKVAALRRPLRRTRKRPCGLARRPDQSPGGMSAVGWVCPRTGPRRATPPLR